MCSAAFLTSRLEDKDKIGRVPPESPRAGGEADGVGVASRRGGHVPSVRGPTGGARRRAQVVHRHAAGGAHDAPCAGAPVEPDAVVRAALDLWGEPPVGAPLLEALLVERVELCGRLREIINLERRPFKQGWQKTTIIKNGRQPQSATLSHHGNRAAVGEDVKDGDAPVAPGRPRRASNQALEK